MRISDWSSDVCSSDLTVPAPEPDGGAVPERIARSGAPRPERDRGARADNPIPRRRQSLHPAPVSLGRRCAPLLPGERRLVAGTVWLAPLPASGPRDTLHPHSGVHAWMT